MTTTPIIENRTTTELAYQLADVLTGQGHVDQLHGLLATDVRYLVPGRGAAAGLHEGVESVIGALIVGVTPQVQVDRTVLTELLVTGERAMVIVETSGHQHLAGAKPAGFAYETAFHLRCRGGRIVGITEYSADQYAADQYAADEYSADDYTATQVAEPSIRLADR